MLPNQAPPSNPAEPTTPAGTEALLEQRIEEEKARISGTLRMMSDKVRDEVAVVEHWLADYSLPLCSAAAVLGFWMAPRRIRLTPAIIQVQSPDAVSIPDLADLADEPAQGFTFWPFKSVLGGLIVGAVAVAAVKLLTSRSAAPEPSARHTSPGAGSGYSGSAIPPYHLSRGGDPGTESGFTGPEVGRVPDDSAGAVGLTAAHVSDSLAGHDDLH